MRRARRQPMRCLCTPLRWTLCGEGWGRWAVWWGVSGGYMVQPRLLLGEGELRLSFLRCQGCGSNSEVLIQVRPSNFHVVGKTRPVLFVSLFFFGCYAATQLVLQLQEEHTQVVCSNKEARKRLVWRHSRNGPWTHEYCFEVMYFYVCSVFTGCGMWNVFLK